MLRKTLAVAAVLTATLTGVAQAETINFGIISTESQQNLKNQWEPFLADLQRKTGLEVKAYFAPDYAGIIEGMRFNKVQVAWYGNKSAMEAVDRAEGEIFVQTIALDGNPGYWSHLIVHKDSPLNSVEDVLSKAGELSFGNGDPNSTSGFLVPGYYVFAQNNVDPKKAFKRVVNANHETNALAVANRQVDVATNNSENLQKLEKSFPEKRKELKVIWTSPLIPGDPIVWRKDLPDATKDKLRAFFLEYGVKGDKAEAEKKVLAGLLWSPFRASDNDQLLPIRQLELFKTRVKIETDEKLAADEKAAKLAEIDDKLKELAKRLAAKASN